MSGAKAKSQEANIQLEYFLVIRQRIGSFLVVIGVMPMAILLQKLVFSAA